MKQNHIIGPRLRIQLMSFQIIVMALFLSSLTSCIVSSQLTELNSEGQEIPIFTGEPNVSSSYIEVVDIELTGSIFTSRRRLRERLIETAADQKCDAVINVEFKTTFIWPQALGTGIRYRK